MCHQVYVDSKSLMQRLLDIYTKGFPHKEQHKSAVHQQDNVELGYAFTGEHLCISVVCCYSTDKVNTMTVILQDK